jgi:hypothetical protein
MRAQLTGRNAWSWWHNSGWHAVAADPMFVSAGTAVVLPPRPEGSCPVRWDTTFGGEDGLAAVDAPHAAASSFRPRYFAVHEEYRETFAQLRAWQRRLAYGMARCGPVQREGAYKRLLSRVPVHYFALLRLPRMYARLRETDELRARFVRLLPWLVIAEWSLGIAALRYSVPRPPLRTPNGRARPLLGIVRWRPPAAVVRRRSRRDGSSLGVCASSTRIRAGSDRRSVIVRSTSSAACHQTPRMHRPTTRKGRAPHAIASSTRSEPLVQRR